MTNRYLCEVLACVFDYLFLNESTPGEFDQGKLKSYLQQSGFDKTRIDGAIDWLHNVANDEASPNSQKSTSGIRIYNELEQQKMTVGARNYLQYIENIGLISPLQREVVIEHIMDFNEDHMSEEDIRILVLSVLFEIDRKDTANMWLEFLILGEDNTCH